MSGPLRGVAGRTDDDARASKGPDSRFAVIRTPLLPLAEFVEWGSAAAEPDREAPGETYSRARLRARLREVVSRPVVREALFIASPDLEEMLPVWLEQPESERGRKIERSLVRYFARMCGRATPYGLFAGCSVGEVAECSRLELAPLREYRRRSRLDVEFVDALYRGYERQPHVRARMRLRPNSSLYLIAGQARYVEVRLGDNRRTHHLVAVNATATLRAVLKRSAAGATRAELIDVVTSDTVDAARARDYVERLIAEQVLVPEMAATVTGEEPSEALVGELRGIWPDGPWGPMEEAVAKLAAIDAEGVGVTPVRYRTLAGRVAELPARVELGRLFQVDLIKPAATLTLGRDVVRELHRGAELLARITPREYGLADFRAAFQERYEQRLVPLAEALDDELGIGLPLPGVGMPAREPLVNGLPFPRLTGRQVPWSDREGWLLDRVLRAAGAGERELVLSKADVEALSLEEHAELPRACALLGAAAARSPQALQRGDFRVRLDEVLTNSGAQLLGRFCHADPALHRRVLEHLRAEEAVIGDAVLAEVVHLPEGRHGNFICRPVLREYEITYLGRSGAPAERQLPLEDLLIGVRGETVLLWSRRLNRRVIPRLTCAHNYSRYGTPVYRFLCLLQQGPSERGLAWSWGPLADAPFLPRVRHGRVVLSLARWLLGKHELRALADAGYDGAQALRRTRALPRLVTVEDGDRRLPVDLSNPLSVEAFVELVGRRERVALAELWPPPEELCVRGPEGRFVSELVVPMILEHRQPPAVRANTWDAEAAGPARRVFEPGSEWLYLKLYTGTATADRVLARVLKRTPHHDLGDRWFFIRYDDPDHHLRLRFHGDPDRLRERLWPALNKACSPLLGEGLIRKIVLDSYERETERYGGEEGIALAERIFEADSEAVLGILAMLDSGEAGGRERWLIAACGASMLMSDLGLDAAQRLALLERLRADYGREYHADAALRRAMGQRLRPERATLEALLDPQARGAGTGLEPGVRELERRSEQIAPLVAQLDALEAHGRLRVARPTLAASYAHMHLFRILRTAQRRQELVIYDFLLQLARSQHARQSQRR